MARNDGEMISSAGGALAVLGLVLALSGKSEGDDDDPGDGDPPGNGDPDPNQPPTGSISTDVLESSVQATANASDPDGSVVGYDWTLSKGLTDLQSKAGQSVSFSLVEDGLYDLKLVVTDDKGATDTAFTQFEYSAPDDGGDQISSTYNGHPKADYYYCGTDTSAFDAWKMLQITTEEFATRTSRGDGTAQLQLDPCTAPNEGPSVSIDSFNVNSDTGIISAAATGSDPDGNIVTWAWELGRNGSTIDTANGQSVQMNMGGDGEYELRVMVMDDKGATATDTFSFPYSAPDTNESPSATITGFTTNADAGTLDASGTGSDPDGSIQSLEWTFERGSTIVDTATGSDVTLNYDGTGTYTLTLAAVDQEGARGTDSYQFDYEAPDGGNGEDRYYETIERTVGSAKTANISVFQTEQLMNKRGRSPEYTVANALADAFEHMGFDVIVKLGMPSLPAATEASGCHSDAGYPNGALDWFQEFESNGNIPDEYMSEDSNIMLVDALGGGCGESRGGDLCIAGANRFDSYFPWEPLMELVPAERPGSEPNPRVQTLGHCLHEVGHNFNMGHGCGVIERIDATEEVIVPLNHPGDGGTNGCGEVSDDRPDSYTWYLRAHWDEPCCMSQLAIK